MKFRFVTQNLGRGFSRQPALLVLAGIVALVLSGLSLPPSRAQGDLVTVKAKPMPADEPRGEPPYEMVLADRRPASVRLVNFDSLDGWTLECSGGAVGELAVSQRERLWDSRVARLVYRGTGPDSSVTLRLPEPLAIPSAITAATLWIYGNNWAWEPDPKTPRVNVVLLLKDQTGQERPFEIVQQLGWKEWWLVHKLLPADITAKAPLQLAGIRVTGCANSEDRELYFEDLAFIQESFKPLSFGARPKRGIDPFPGQDPGANTGPGRLPFPTREQTILPENLQSSFIARLVSAGPDTAPFRFIYEAADERLEYEIRPQADGWGPVTVKLGGVEVGRALVGAGPVFEKPPEELRLKQAAPDGQLLRGTWTGQANGKPVTVESTIRLWQKSLVVDYVCRGGAASGLSYGHLQDVAQPELILMPFLNYGGHHLHVLAGHGTSPWFASIWMDWYRSNASEPYAEDRIKDGEVWLNGGVRYLPKTDGKRNDLYERLFVTFSPAFEETLPTVANPPAKRGKEAATRLWQETWGPKDYEKEKARSRRLRAYGIEQLTQCNHEITWRDSGESFTFRTLAAPKKGGDEALKEYVAAQRSLGWRSGLYTNYTDFAPVNEFWDVDMVMRRSDGNLITAWPRCYAPKALFGLEMDRKLAPEIQKKFGSNAAYTDVHTSVAPWERTDYDARVPGAGTFAATFYAYGDLLLHDQEVYDGHAWSEGNHQWLYAGLCTGNYGLTYSDLRLWKYPYLPHFDLLKMHPLSVDIGMPWTEQFFQDKEDWNRPEKIESSIDQFIAATIAYGHMGWLVEETHGIRQTCRSYYALQELQSRAAMLKPETIRYGSAAGLVTSSDALASGEWKQSRLYIRYPGALEIWVNGNAGENWTVEAGGKPHVLPPFGWLARQGALFYEASELIDGKRSDRVTSPAYLFLDGRGSVQYLDGLSTAGSIAVRKGEGERSVSVIAVDGVESFALEGRDVHTPRHELAALIVKVARAGNVAVRVFDDQGKELEPPEIRPRTAGWEIRAREGGVRYEIQGR